MTVLYTSDRVSSTPDFDDFRFITPPTLDGSGTMTMRVNFPSWNLWPPGNGDLVLCFLDVVVDAVEANFPPNNLPYIRWSAPGVWDLTFTTDTGIFTDFTAFRGYRGATGDAHDPTGSTQYTVLSAGPMAPAVGDAYNGLVPLLDISSQDEGPFDWPLTLGIGVSYRGPAPTEVQVDFGDGTNTAVPGVDIDSSSSIEHTYPDAGSYTVTATAVRTGYPGAVVLSAYFQFFVRGLVPFNSVTLEASGTTPIFTFVAHAVKGGGET